jgi:hypothetical protein
MQKLEQNRYLELMKEPTYRLISQGGDYRIAIDEKTGLNYYGCSPEPKPTLSYSSSTASTITNDGYRYLQIYHESLLQVSRSSGVTEACRRGFEQIRQRLRNLYALPAGATIGFGPSGTDLELIPLAIANRGNANGVHNITIESDEVGSGVAYASRGRHWGDKTALGVEVKRGTLIPGFDSVTISNREMPLRQISGKPADQTGLLQSIRQEIQHALAKSMKPLVHIVHQSKTGLIAPNWRLLNESLSDLWDKLDIVVDACQGRISVESTRAYLSGGAAVMLTGSKFFAGPPFSGVIFLPKDYTNKAKQVRTWPSGLNAYFTEAEIPREWGVPSGFCEEHNNIGLLLRWEAAMYEMQRFFGLSRDRRDAVVKNFQAALLQFAKESRILEIEFSEMSDYRERKKFVSLDKKTIFILRIKRNEADGDCSVSFAESQILRELLIRDLTGTTASRDKRMSINIQVGQPVKARRLANGCWQGNLRVALSAPKTVNLARSSNDEMRTELVDDLRLIEAKILHSLKFI